MIADEDLHRRAMGTRCELGTESDASAWHKQRRL